MRLDEWALLLCVSTGDEWHSVLPVMIYCCCSSMPIQTLFYVWFFIFSVDVQYFLYFFFGDVIVYFNIYCMFYRNAFQLLLIAPNFFLAKKCLPMMACAWAELWMYILFFIHSKHIYFDFPEKKPVYDMMEITIRFLVSARFYAKIYDDDFFWLPNITWFRKCFFQNPF